MTNQIHPVFWDIENDVGYYINRTNLPYTLQKRRLYLQKASLFYDQRCTNTTLLEETELDFGVACDFSINGYDRYDATHFCVYGYKETSNTASGCAGKLYCFVFGLDGTLYKTITVESPCKKTRVADMSMGYLKGYLLIAGVVTEQDGTWPIYRVPENNPTDIQAAEIGMMSENVQRFFKFSLGETYYLYDSEYYGGGARRYRLLAYNVVSNRITLTNVLMPTLYFQGPLYPVGQRYRQIPIAGHDFWYMSGYDANGTYIKTNNGGWLYRVRMFLSTINNLSEPITKTADKTMKITYTITEVDE